MKEEFFAYYQPSKREFADIWDSAIVSFDACSLLALYRYSSRTQSDFLHAIESVSQSHTLWLTHQATKEFFRSRCSRIYERMKECDEGIKKINDALRSLNPSEHRCILDSDDRLEGFSRSCSDIVEDLQRSKSQAECRLANDPLLDTLEGIFGQCIGKPFSQEELTQIFREGKSRFESKVPPGYKDSSKPEPDRYGDLVIWKELLRKSLQDRKNIIFITEDTKEDWFFRPTQRNLGPHPELLFEFSLATKGQRAYIYDNLAFIRYAKTSLDTTVSPESECEIGSFDQQEAELAQRVISLQSEALVLDQRIIESESEIERCAGLSRGLLPGGAGFRGVGESWQELNKQHALTTAQMHIVLESRDRLMMKKEAISRELERLYAEIQK